MLNNCDGILFDVDGTLTATNDLIFASFNHIMGKYAGKQLTNQEIIALFGPTEDVIIEQYFPDCFEEAKADYYQFYRAHHLAMADVYPGIPALLDKIQKKGLKIGAFTGKGRRAAEITFEVTGIAAYFDMLISGDDVVNHKPHNEGIEKFLHEYSLSPERIFMVGDSHVDILAARASGVRAIAVFWDSYSIEQARALNPDYIVHSVNELEVLLLGAE